MVAGRIDLDRESLVARDRLALLVVEGAEAGFQHRVARVVAIAPLAARAVPVLDDPDLGLALRPEIALVGIVDRVADTLERADAMVPEIRPELLELVSGEELRVPHVTRVREIEAQRARVVIEGRLVDAGDLEIRITLVARHHDELRDDIT